MNRIPGTVIKLKARAKVSDISKDTGQYTVEVDDIHDITEEEIVRMSEKDSLNDDDLVFLFGEDE